MQQTVIIGSKNPTKVEAVRNVFSNFEVNSLEVPSNVSVQPFSDEETRIGAINRAKGCISGEAGSIGIGLEGGVMYVDDTLFLCNWGALATADGELFTASGARIALPKEFEKELKTAGELSVVMDAYTKKKMSAVMKVRLVFLQITLCQEKICLHMLYSFLKDSLILQINS